MYKLNSRKIKVLMFVLLSFPVFVSFQNCAKNPEATDNFSSLDGATNTEQDPTKEDLDPIIEKEPEQSLTMTSSLLDRQALYETLVDVLGTNSKNLAAMKRLNTQKDIFGGPCSVYDNFRSVRGGTPQLPKTDPDSVACLNSDTGIYLTAPVLPVANVLRQAVINDICNQSKDNTTVFNYVLSQLKDNPTDLVPANTSSNALKLFYLFYRGKPAPDSTLIDSLQLIIGSPATNDGWKTAYLATCLSNHWQAL